MMPPETDVFLDLTPSQTATLLEQLRGAQDHDGLVQLRVGVDCGEVKWSINARVWTPPMGPQRH